MAAQNPRYVVHELDTRYFAVWDTRTELAEATRTDRKAAEQRAGWLNRREAIAASTCETCRDGCHCSADPGAGCAHLGCWGTDATGDCPEAVRLTAAYPLR